MWNIIAHRATKQTHRGIVQNIGNRKERIKIIISDIEKILVFIARYHGEEYYRNICQTIDWISK